MGGANRATRFEARRMDRYATDSERSLHRVSFARRRPATVDLRSLRPNAGGEGLCSEPGASHRRLQSVLVDSHDVQIAVATFPFAEYRHRIGTVDWRAGTGGVAREHATGTDADIKDDSLKERHSAVALTIKRTRRKFKVRGKSPGRASQPLKTTASYRRHQF